MQQLQPLRIEFARHLGETRNVTAWPCEARDKTELHGTTGLGKHDRDRARRCLQRGGLLRTDADDHRRPPLHHLARDDAEPVRLALAIARLDQDGSSLYVTEPFERNAKRAEPLGFYRRAAAHHHANARNPWRLLGGREAR